MTNYRDKIIADNIAFCLRNKRFLSDWENGFIGSVDSQAYPLTPKQFNTLQDVTEKLSRGLTSSAIQ